MYIQLTTRCNMTCEHCCFSCTNEGDDMTRATFNKCLEMSNGHVHLGGGEPTMHPDFELLLCDALASDNIMDEGLSIITNGTYRKRALLLAKLHSAGAIYASVSKDDFHDVDMVHPDVWEAYRTHYHDVTHEGSRDPLPHGRAIKYLGLEDEELPAMQLGLGCACEELHVKPNGNTYACGCEDAPLLGNIHQLTCDQIPPSACWRSEEYAEWEEA